MLVLHRNINESVTLITPDGQRITVKVASFQRGGVRLAFDADPSVAIVRTELADKQPAIVRKILGKTAPTPAAEHEISAT